LIFTKNLFGNISAIELIKVNGRGPNALDIFIAFYLGRYFDSIKESEIIIYSKDSYYDQLVKHLNGYGISIKRVSSIKNVTKQIVESKELTPQKRTSKAEIKTGNIQKIIEFLQKQTKSQKNKMPKKTKTLENFLYTHFAKNISVDQIRMAIEFMEKNKNITITNDKVNYNNI
jgi:hypothetical protein